MLGKSILFVLGCGLVQQVQGGCVADAPTCYSDDMNNRILGNNVNPGSTLTIEYCAQLCQNKGMPIAGVEFGQECYCGASIKSSATKIDMTKCNMNCNADKSKEHCGGDDAIAIFSYKCSGTPVPVPVGPAQPPELFNPCLNQSDVYAKMPFCDYKLGYVARVNDAVNRMTIQEKVGMLDTGGQPVQSLGIPSYNWWSEASTGVATGRGTQTTKFAFPITTGMSFNRSLWQATGRQIGVEARAMMNAGNGLSTFWAPVINLAREPRWGRNIETPGEDPYQSGEYATYFVKGMEQAPEDPTHIQASACCKHYVANSMDGSTENGVEHDRNHYDATISQQDLLDSYMVPFQACVEKGRVSGLMCSYNAVNGVPSCANDWLLNQVAREDWGFDGYVTSDCDADNDVVFSHHYTDIPEQGVQDVLRAGTDVDCGGFVGKYAMSALNKSFITEDDINTRIAMLLRVRMRLGHFDPVGPLQSIPQSDICSDYAIELSHNGPVQSAALLKNSMATLPLSPAKAGTVAVIGPTSNLSKSDAGYYGPRDVCGGNFFNMVDAVGTQAQHVVTALGVPSVLSNDMSGIPAAVEMAKNADTVILSVGTDLSWAAEGHDAKWINFTAAQQQLISEVSAAAKNPVVLVLQTATPLDISAQLANPKIGAILHLGQPSVTVLGVGKLLYGDVSPAGRTVQTFYKTSYADQISIFDFAMRPGPSPFPRPDCGTLVGCPNGTNPGRTYRFYEDTPVIPFGFGLSYSSFSYNVVSGPVGTVSISAVEEMIEVTKKAGKAMPSLKLLESASPLVEYNVKVTNTGSVDADDVVLGFVVPPGAGQNGVPLKQLFGFERIHLKAGESKMVYLYPSLSYFSHVSVEGDRHALAGEYTVEFGVNETSKFGMGFTQHKFILA